MPALSGDPNVFVPLRKCWALFEDVASREDRMVGWYVGQFIGDHKLSDGLLRELDHAPTLFDALRKLCHLVSSEASHLQLGLVAKDDCLVFYTRYEGMCNEPGYAVSQAYQLEAYIHLIRRFAGVCWQPKQIGIEHSEYPDDLQDRYPSSQILTNQPFGYLAIPYSSLPCAIKTPHVNNESAKEPLVDLASLSDTEKLGYLLEPYLHSGYLSMRFAAELMGTSVRTLARRLADCGASYQAVIDNARFDKARRLLLEKDLSINDVARSVGFDNQSNFTRMFRRISGITPRQFRSVEFHNPL